MFTKKKKKIEWCVKRPSLKQTPDKSKTYKIASLFFSKKGKSLEMTGFQITVQVIQCLRLLISVT